MLHWLKNLGRKPDHPMYNLVEAQKLLAELPTEDSLKSLEEVTFWLESVRTGEGFRLDTKVDVLALLDDTGLGFQRRIYRDYVSNPNMARVHRHRLWLLLFEYHKAQSDAYLACLDEFNQGVKGVSEVKDRLPVLAGRAMAALGAQRKLLHLRYREVDPRIWAEMARVYVFAEGRSISRNVVPLYAGRASYSSVQREMLKPLIHDVAPLGAFTVTQMELADRLIQHFANSFVFREVRDADCEFAFDLSKPGAPQRLRDDHPSHELMRYFGAGVGLPKLEMLIKQVEMVGAVPPEIEFGREVKNEELLEVLKPLVLHWSKTPPHRVHARERVDSKLAVVTGFMEIRRKVAAMEKGEVEIGRGEGDILYQEQLDLKLYGFITEKTKHMKEEAAARRATMPETVEDKSIHTWTMDNVSEGGLGAVLGQRADWVKVGTLIGVRPQGSDRWALGLIRRLGRNSKGEVTVGVQIVSYQPQSVRLCDLMSADVSGWEKVTDSAQYDFVSAFLMPAGLGNESPTLLVPNGYFASDRSYVLITREMKQHIKLTELLDQGEDFERVRYREMATAGEHSQQTAPATSRPKR